MTIRRGALQFFFFFNTSIFSLLLLLFLLFSKREDPGLNNVEVAQSLSDDFFSLSVIIFSTTGSANHSSN